MLFYGGIDHRGGMGRGEIGGVHLPYQLERTFAHDGYIESPAVAVSKQDF
jgi:hypothetical protein